MKDNVLTHHKDGEYLRIVDAYPTNLLKLTAGINLLYVIFFFIGVISVLFDNSELFIKRIVTSSLLVVLGSVYIWIAMQLLKFNIKARALTIISFPIILLLLYPFSLILIPIQMYSLIFHTRTRKQFVKDEEDEVTN
ncbi:MAG: hypothetical protein ACXAB7_09910 [Candidatus Kariarchaeaceae archaeon]|jgi:hypothetical protein